MPLDNVNERNADEASLPQNIDQETVQSPEEFTENLLCFFRNALKDSLHLRNQDQSELVGRSWAHFHPYMKEVRHEDIYIEMLFSVFEIFPCTKYKSIFGALEGLVLRKIYEYRCVKFDLTLGQALIDSSVCFIHYFADPLQEDMNSADTFCSPALLLDFSVMVRLLRYGACFKINPLQTWQCVTTILECLTVKLLPEVYKYVEWESSNVNFLYLTFHDQMRLYWVLLFVYVMVQSKKPDFFPNWRNYMESLKLVFKACTEPFITAEEIDMFLRVVTVGDFDERVSEDLCKMCAEEFPRIKEPYTPRSLKQLSRCRVRECLTSSRSLPHGVCYLNIATELKRYIVLQKTFDEFFPKYVSSLCSTRRSAEDEDDGFNKRANTNA